MVPLTSCKAAVLRSTESQGESVYIYVHITSFLGDNICVFFPSMFVLKILKLLKVNILSLVAEVLQMTEPT